MMRELQSKKRARDEEEEREQPCDCMYEKTPCFRTRLQVGDPMPWKPACDLDEELSAGALEVLRDECAIIVHNYLRHAGLSPYWETVTSHMDTIVQATLDRGLAK